MSSKPSPPRPQDTLSFKIGSWVEASATGWGLAVLVVLAIVAGVVVLTRWPALLPH